MREQSFTFDKGLVGGLRSHPRSVRSVQQLVECLGLKCGKMGLEELREFVKPFVNDTWPFPQLYKGMSKTLLFTSSAVYEVDESDLSLTLAFSYEAEGEWHIADYGLFILMTDGSTAFYLNTETGLWEMHPIGLFNYFHWILHEHIPLNLPA